MRFPLIYLLTTLLSIFSCVAQPYYIKGNTKGLPDGTWIYLSNTTTNVLQDSVQVNNNHFELKGVMEVSLERMALHTAGYRQYKLFWLEPGTTIVVMNDKKLFNARIEGGTVTNDEAKLRQIIAPIAKEMEQLEAAIEKEKNEDKRNSLLAHYNKLTKQEELANQQFVEQHPQALYSMFLLSVYGKQWGANTTRTLFGKINPDLQQTSFGKTISRYLSIVRDVGIDSLFADVSAPDTSGIIRTLSGQKGKWVLLEFWASWCGPCREANPALRQLYTDLQGYPFEIFAVSLDKDATAWKKAIIKDQLPWLHVSQLKGFDDDAALTYSISAIPNNFLINPDGKIVAIDVEPDRLREMMQSGRQ